MRRQLFTVVAIAIATTALVGGCSAKPDYTARFVGYKDMPGGERVALVSPVQEPGEQQTAYTNISDLKAGEYVYIHYTGRSWDVPRSKPEREIVSRSPRR